MTTGGEKTGNSFFRRLFSFFAIRLFARPMLRNTSRTQYRGLRITVFPGVFHPGLYFSSRLLADIVGGLDLAGRVVLDMGTGTGIIGMVAARRGARVLSVDTSEKAVECAGQNIVQNQLSESIETRKSDLFEHVPPDARFDYIFWNPPFYPRQPEDDRGKAWNAGTEYGVIERFARECGTHISPGGRVVLILSSDMDIPLVLAMFRPLRAEVILSRRKLFEVFTIYQLSE